MFRLLARRLRLQLQTVLRLPAKEQAQVQADVKREEKLLAGLGRIDPERFLGKEELEP